MGVDISVVVAADDGSGSSSIPIQASILADASRLPPENDIIARPKVHTSDQEAVGVRYTVAGNSSRFSRIAARSIASSSRVLNASPS